MKKHLPLFLSAFFGVCAGFVGCYATLVLPQRVVGTVAAPSHVALKSMPQTNPLDWRPLLVQPVLPPTVVPR
jgi:hypothetical protein